MKKQKDLIIKFPEMNSSRGQYQLKFLLEVARLWNRYPQQRFFQLLSNYTILGTRTPDLNVQDPFYYLDGEILRQIKRHNQ